MGVPFITNMEVVPVSETACVRGILGGHGCTPGAHSSSCIDVIDVTTVMLSSSTNVFRVG